jgi:hypothetical protein
MLRKIFGPDGDEVARDGENCILRSFMIFTHNAILFKKLR